LSSHRSEIGDRKEKEEEEETAPNFLLEKHVSINLKTYARYIGSNPINYFFFPLTVLVFIANEIVLTFFLRFLANYDLVRLNKENLFGNDFPLFWGILGLMAGLYLLTLFIKYLLLYLTMLYSNITIH
jgi:hypothetical protein